VAEGLQALDPAEFDLRSLVKATEGYSSSEIEPAVVSAMYHAHAKRAALTQVDLIAEIRATRPLPVVRSERVQELRDWASTRTVPCD
jgi:hypothetical protein